jgi:hypothetical protein
MRSVQIPGSAWVIILALINTLPVALNDAFPGAVWVPLVVDLLLVVAKAIQVYAKPSGKPVEPSGPAAANFVAPSASAPVIEAGNLRKFLLG